MVSAKDNGQVEREKRDGSCTFELQRPALDVLYGQDEHSWVALDHHGRKEKKEKDGTRRGRCNVH